MQAHEREWGKGSEKELVGSRVSGYPVFPEACVRWASGLCEVLGCLFTAEAGGLDWHLPGGPAREESRTGFWASASLGLLLFPRKGMDP